MGETEEKGTKTELTERNLNWGGTLNLEKGEKRPTYLRR